MKKGGRLLGVTVVAAILTATVGATVIAQSRPEPEYNTVETNPAPTRPRVGLICVWAIYASLAEIGRRCGVAPRPAAQAALDSAVSRMEAYARTRSPDAAAGMERYKQRDIIGDPRLCSSDMVDAFRRAPRDVDTGIAQAHREIDELLAQSPPVEWGDTCV